MTDRADGAGVGREVDPERGAAADPEAGRGLVVVDLIGTVALVLVTILAALVDADLAVAANLAVSGVLFVGGCVAFAIGFLRAAARSRTEVVDLAGLFYLTGSAPRRTRRTLLGLWFVQIGVVTVTVTAIDPPFGVMAPVWGIGVLTAWGARHGTFPSRPAPGGPGRRSAPE